MLSLTEVFAILYIHWFADFVCQTGKEAANKSSSLNWLLLHTAKYSIVWFVCGMIYYLCSADFNDTFQNNDKIFGRVMWFFYITLVMHTITDYFTSRIVAKKFARKEYYTPFPNRGAFSVIGFDQILHYVQLFLTYYFLK